jgi:hypothetical protein
MDNHSGSSTEHGGPPQAGSIVPGIVITALLLGGGGVLLYGDWRRAHPVAPAPDGIQPMLKIPGEIPKALRNPTFEAQASGS